MFDIVYETTRDRILKTSIRVASRAYFRGYQDLQVECAVVEEAAFATRK